jgi:RND family efflux transporter MFP subunit
LSAAFAAGPLLLMLAAPLLLAQANQPALVRYTEARERQLRRRVTLLGTVEAHNTSVVASEVAGKVFDLPVEEGDGVEKGQVLARLNTQTVEYQLAAVEAELREAQARLKLAEANLARATDLYESEIFAQQQLDSSASEYSAWKGRCEKLEADIARIKNDIEEATIRAPFGGRVVQKETEIGEWVAEGGPVVEIVALNPLDVTVDVPERHYRNLRLGTRARVSFEALPNLEVRGQIVAIIPQANVEARTYPVKFQIRNRGGRIGVGMLAKVSFAAGDLYKATMVPKDALVTKGEKNFVFRIRGQSKVEQLPVETGEGLGSWIEVRGAIQPGERVVTRGNERLFPGQPVRGQPLNYRMP